MIKKKLSVTVLQSCFVHVNHSMDCRKCQYMEPEYVFTIGMEWQVSHTAFMIQLPQNKHTLWETTHKDEAPVFREHEASLACVLLTKDAVINWSSAAQSKFQGLKSAFHRKVKYWALLLQFSVNIMIKDYFLNICKRLFMSATCKTIYCSWKKHSNSFAFADRTYKDRQTSFFKLLIHWIYVMMAELMSN